MPILPLLLLLLNFWLLALNFQKWAWYVLPVAPLDGKSSSLFPSQTDPYWGWFFCWMSNELTYGYTWVELQYEWHTGNNEANATTPREAERRTGQHNPPSDQPSNAAMSLFVSFLFLFSSKKALSSLNTTSAKKSSEGRSRLLLAKICCYIGSRVCTAVDV